MAKQLSADSLDGLFKIIEEQKSKDIFVLFCGALDEAGKSWCPDCVAAEPTVKAGVSKLPEEAVFIHCTVGDKPTWKDPQNCFRTHQKTQLKGVPTLVKWGTPKKLVEEECQKADLVNMLFEEE